MGFHNCAVVAGVAIWELRHELVGSGGTKSSEEQLRSHSQDLHESKQSPWWHSPKLRGADHRASLLAALAEGSPQGHLSGGRNGSRHSPQNDSPTLTPKEILTFGKVNFEHVPVCLLSSNLLQPPKRSEGVSWNPPAFFFLREVCYES